MYKLNVVYSSLQMHTNGPRILVIQQIYTSCIYYVLNIFVGAGDTRLESSFPHLGNSLETVWMYIYSIISDNDKLMKKYEAR